MILIILLLYISCKFENEQIEVRDIKLVKSFENPDKISLSEIASKIEYISLETAKQSLIGTLKRPNIQVQFSGKDIFVNSGNILRFDSSGKFLNMIGANGKGPEEYVGVNSFTIAIQKEDTVVNVYSAAQKKSLFFNLKGDFLRALPIDFMPTNLNAINNNYVYFNSIGRRSRSNNYAVSIVSQKGDIKKRLIYKEKEKKQDFAMTALNTNYKFRDTLSYWENNYDTIWRITKDFKSIPKYFINIGINKIPIQKATRENVFNFKYFSQFDKILMIFETEEQLFFEVIFQSYLHHVVYNKRTNGSKSLKFKNSFQKGFNLSFYNDIDGGIPFWPQGRVSDNKIFMLVYGFELKDYIAKKGKNFDAIDKTGRDKLLKLVEKSKISDNPILMVVTLKE